MKKIQVTFLVLIILLFNSCIGLKIDIQMNRDGSGKLMFEYRISRAFESIGNFEGNEKWPVIPAGRADWQRSIDRIDDAKLTSFSSSQRGPDTITTVTIEYDNPEALLEILDPYTQKSRISIDNRSGLFSYTINESAASNSYNFDNMDFDESLIELARTMFSDYKFSFSFTAPENPTLILTDGSGNTIPAPTAAEISSSGKKATMTIGIIDLVELREGIGIKVTW